MYTLHDLFLNEWESIHYKGYGFIFFKMGTKILGASVRNLITGHSYTIENLGFLENQILKHLGTIWLVVKKDTPQEKVNKKIKQMEQRYE